MNGLIGLTENAPAYAIMGNHEWWTNPDRWRRELIRSPINYIEGSVLHLSVKGVNLCLRGLGDAFTGHDKPVPFSSSCTGLKLTLTHDPYGVQRSPEEGIYFAGHTHCGQIKLPLIAPYWTPTEASQEYWYGYRSDGDKEWITRSGVGTTILPFRLGTNSAIELVKVR